MARHTFTTETHPHALQAFLFHIVHSARTRQTSGATSIPHASRQNQQQQLQIIWLLIFYSGSMLCVADSATSLGSSLAITGPQTLHWNETLVSDNGQFAVGFYHNAMMPVDAGYNLAIWYAKAPNKTTVWMPETSTVLSNQAILSLSKEGDLELQDSISPGSFPVWTSSTKMMNVTMATILNTGNFVLYNTRKDILWQSFDYPSNTLLPTQRYSSNKNMLYSWMDGNNYTKGQYVLKWNTMNYLELNYLSSHWVQYVMYWSNWIPTLSNATNIGITSVVLTPKGEFQAFLTPNIFNIIGKSNITTLDYLRRITLDSDGNLRMYSWLIGSSNTWNVEWAAILTTCQIMGWCGPFAFCEAGFCQCPQGFNWIDVSNKKKGCTRIKNPYYCNKTNVVDDLLSLPGDYPYGVDLAYYANVSIEYCQKACLNACTCQCATISYPDANGNVRCWLKSDTLINGVFQNDRTSYLRMAPTSINNKNKQILSSSTASLIIFIIGPFMVIFGLISCFLSWSLASKWMKIYQLHRLGKKWKISHGTVVRLTYNDIKLITQNFTEKIGKGGYGTVYKGEIGDADAKVVVAVKQLDKLDQGIKTFINEVDVIGNIHHIHLIHLLGYCADAHHKVLVYEYMEKRSLDMLLFQLDKSMPILEWRPRFNIAIQTAKGLAYLHDDVRDQRIIHCDVKPENILVNSTYLAKVADFGLSRILNREQSLTMTSHIRGTCGYLAPEWTSNHTPITPKTDVYSFGMVLFEIVSGCRNSKSGAKSSSATSNEFDMDSRYFPLWAFFKLNESNFNILEVLDPSLTGMANHEEVERVLKVAFWCINNNHQLRPSMSKVVQMLEGHVPIELPLPQPNFNDKFLTESSGSPILIKEIPT